MEEETEEKGNVAEDDDDKSEDTSGEEEEVRGKEYKEPPGRTRVRVTTVLLLIVRAARHTITMISLSLFRKKG